uniref:Zgc:174906 n=1 Tax=Denticeps clupeoides TaxID=299321 RepID=A0AAY4C0U5_9TELE
MEEGTADGARRLRRLKPELLDVLSSDADFVLQHADSLGLLTPRQYLQVKSLASPHEKVRELLDHVIQKGDAPALRLLELLLDENLQETYPRLRLLGDRLRKRKTTAKRRRPLPEAAARPENVPPLVRPSPAAVVSEQQLMLAAGTFGRTWKQLAVAALGVPAAKLEQAVEENPRSPVMQVFSVLRHWRMREGPRATAARLHALLTQGDWALLPGSLDFLLESI